MLPYLLWNPDALYDDTWRWSSGQGETGYQIWGWGASNFVLAAGLVADRFAQWPFWVPMVAVALPLLLWLLWRQVRTNSLGNACWHYGIFMLGFFYVTLRANQVVIGILFILIIYVTMVYGPIAAMLVELFPTKIRYTSMSLPYHIGNGWFGGLLPATSFAIVASTGDIYAGLWYPIIFASITAVVGFFLMPETKDVDITK